MAFKKGEGGRPKGAPNKADGLIRAKCLALIKDPTYQQNFKKRLEAGELPPALEAMTWHYAIGKPIEIHEVSGPDGKSVPISIVHKHVTVSA